MEIVASYSDFGNDNTSDYVTYRFILDATSALTDLGNHDQNVTLLKAARLLESRAVGVWRSEEHPNVIEARLQSLCEAAEIMLRDNWFDFEWMDGYDIYYTANQED